MIVCFNCSQETKDKIDLLLSKHGYRDYGELIAVSISNLLLLHEEVNRSGSLVIGETELPYNTAYHQMEGNRRRKKEADLPKENAKPGNQILIPEIFLLHGLDSTSIKTIENQIDTFKIGQTFTLDRWIFGQYNKLLPAKTNCRALAHLTLKHDKGVPLDEAAPEISYAASIMGDWLVNYDRKNNIGRDDALATAFPYTKPDVEKSRARYLNHFLGNVNTNGQLSGLLWDYRLVTLSKTDPPEILLTKNGLTFAKLKNPIFDEKQDRTTRRLTDEESSFLLDHIQTFVPVENFAIKTLLKLISDGANTPEKLREALHSLMPSDSARPLSDSFLASQRSGALSRMSDMGLIARVRQGVRVTYVITDFGSEFIRRGDFLNKGGTA